tara:strand:+ start:5435 stop:6340 length:906 start_codon:yes stop_codon:yes gene_type:complete
MQINNVTVIDRGNRPNYTQRVGLVVYFINDGAYVDPYEVSAVQIFDRSATLTPSSVLNATNLVSGVPLMTFGASGATLTTDSNFDESNYTPHDSASGIFRLSQGKYVVVLDNSVNLSGWDAETSTENGGASTSSVGQYVDLWTVKLAQASNYQVISQDFTLFEDTFFAFTEPLMLTASNKLLNKKVRFGEVIDLKVTTDTTVQNKNIPKSVQNIFKDSVITSATVTIKKVNQDPSLEGPFSVVTSATMDITADNTLLYNWDTNDIVCSAAFGSSNGTYSVRVKYTILNQTIISPLYYLTVS